MCFYWVCGWGRGSSGKYIQSKDSGNDRCLGDKTRQDDWLCHDNNENISQSSYIWWFCHISECMSAGWINHPLILQIFVGVAYVCMKNNSLLISKHSHTMPQNSRTCLATIFQRKIDGLSTFQLFSNGKYNRLNT